MTVLAVEKIAARLFIHHDIVLPPDTELRRLGGGQWARAQGRWSWSLWSPTVPAQATYGSQYAATDLLKCQNWEVDTPRRITPDLSIWPCVACQQHGCGTCKTFATDPAKESY